MKHSVLNHLDTLISNYPSLEVCREDILKAFEMLRHTYESKGKLLIAGNGGSAADSEHIVGELMKSFCLPRHLDKDYSAALKSIDSEMGATLAENLQGALPAIALDGHTSLTTAYLNDCNPLLCFAQQLHGFASEGDTFLAISTSGNSKNVVYAAVTAKAKGIKVIALTGARDSRLSALADCTIRVPETATYRIQELHLPVYHCLCLMLEEHFFGTP